MLCLLHHIPTEETIRYALGCAVPKPVDPQWLSKAQTAQQQVLQSLSLIHIYFCLSMALQNFVEKFIIGCYTENKQKFTTIKQGGTL